MPPTRDALPGDSTDAREPFASWSTARRGCYAALGGLVTMAVIGVIALVSHQPFLFPSLGPTVFVIFFAVDSRQAAPRNVVCGQLLGVGAGYLAILVLGLGDVSVDLVHLSPRRLIASTLALCVTFIVMTWLGVEHAPAAATTLIVALGLLPTAVDLLAIMASIMGTVVIALVINRLFRLPYPLWAPAPRAVSPS